MSPAAIFRGHSAISAQRPPIAEKFNTYRFADYKEKVIDLLRRVTTVSVGTMEVVNEMEKAVR